MPVHERTCCSQMDNKYKYFRRFSGCLLMCTSTELKIDMDIERVRIESTFGKYESATTGGNPIGRWASPSSRGCGIRQDTCDHTSHRLSDSRAGRAGGFDFSGYVYE